MRGTLTLFLLIACLCPGQNPHVHSVQIHNFMFQPEMVTAQVGEKIEWTNEDIVPHTVTADDKSFSSGLIQPKKSWTLTVRKEGMFSYYCTPHPNMKGVLVVTAAPTKQ